MDRRSTREFRTLCRCRRSSPWALAAGVAIVTLASLAGCGERTSLGVDRGAPIILVSIDTLRSDRLPTYGSTRIETPAIDALARDGLVYERAYSHVPLTFPSHVALLTGLLPPHNGVRDNTGYLFDAARHPSVAGRLRAAGYATGAAVSSFVLRGETGLASEFDFYESSIDLRTGEALGRSQRPGGETAALALEWIGKQKGKPFFFLLHLYEPHTPYEPAEPFRARYADPYDAEIATADGIVGQFLEGLRSQGVYDRAAIVLLSDHGEGLGDHGEQEHGILLYREAIQVPLVVKLPGGRLGGRRIAAPVGLVDVAPTLLSLAGVELPAGLDGAPLPVEDRTATPERNVYSETFYPRLHLGWNELTSLVRGRFHLIDGPDPEMFDVVADAAEQKNVLRAERRAYAELRAGLENLEAPLEKPAEVDAETSAKLAALGYLGGASVSDLTSPLPDPKSKIASLTAFGTAMQDVAEQRFADAVPKLEQLVRDNPKMIDAWVGLGVARSRSGRQREAFSAYEKAMEVSGGSPQVAIGAASVLIALGRLDEAQKYAEIGMKSSPSAGRELLAQIAEQKGDLGAAEKQIRASLDQGGSQVGPLVSLARLLQKQGKVQEALAHADRALVASRQSGGKHEGLQALRGDLLARLDRGAEAHEAFLAEIQQFPGALLSYSRLATLYASEGKPEEAVAMLRRMTETNRTPAAYGEAVRTLEVLGDRQSATALLRYARSLFPESRELAQLSR